jgi:hypothetical protein
LQKPGALVYFSTIVALTAGDNNIIVSALDQDKRKADSKLKIKRVVPKTHDVGSRYAVSLMPLANPKGDKARLDIIQSKFLHHLTQRKRFALVEREKLDKVLAEMKLSKEKLTDPETSVKIGKLIAAAGMIFGQVNQTDKSLEVVARLVDTETGKVLFSQDAYTENLELKALDEMCERLSWKFILAYPLIEGSVVKISGSTVYTDLGKNAGVFSGMQLVVFQLGEEVKLPSGESLGADTKEIGPAVIASVEDKFSKAEVKNAAVAGKIKAGMKVITR